MNTSLNDNVPEIATIKESLHRYAEGMSLKKAVNEVDGVKYQTLLLSTLKTAFRLEHDDFNRAFGIIEEWVRSHKDDVMSHRAALRYMQLARRISQKDHAAFYFLMSLLIRCADRRTRGQVISRTPLSRISLWWSENDEVSKLTDYFSQ